MHRSPYRECPMASTADGLGRAGPMCGLLTAILRCLEKIRAFGDYQHMPQVGSLQSPTPSLRFVRGCNPCTHQSAPHSPRGVEAIEETDRPLQHSINDAPSSPFLHPGQSTHVRWDRMDMTLAARATARRVDASGKLWFYCPKSRLSNRRRTRTCKRHHRASTTPALLVFGIAPGPSGCCDRLISWSP